MNIKNHKLDDPKVKKGNSPNQGGEITPTVIVLHYTASGGEDGGDDASYLSRATSKASAHVVVGRDGTIHQIVPFNKKAWHAGVSEYKGHKNVNDFSVGIEIDNWGYLKNGKSHSGTVVPEQFRFEGTRSGHSEWESYRPAQLAAVEQVIAALCDEYNITDIVGHEDIAPGRKQDPGPALDEFKAHVQTTFLNATRKPTPPPTNPLPPTKRTEKGDPKKTTTALRLRAVAATNGAIITVIPQGLTVYEVQRNVYPGWSKVQFGNRLGFVANQYLT